MASFVRILAVATAAIVALSLILFALNESSTESKNQVRSVDGIEKVHSQKEIEQANPAPAAERAREAEHSKPREYIDDANDILVSPFTGLVGTGNIWAQRLVPAALALLLYGLGGLMLANWIPSRTRKTADWRTAP